MERGYVLRSMKLWFKSKVRLSPTHNFIKVNKTKDTKHSQRVKYKGNWHLKLVPVNSKAEGLKDSLNESILCRSGTNSDGMDENVSLVK